MARDLRERILWQYRERERLNLYTAMEDTSGGVHFAEKYSNQRRTTCYIPD